MEKKYKWGILGCGHIAHKFAEALNRLEQAELYAVASSDRKRADEFRNLHHASTSYGSYEAMLDDPEVEIVYVATPHSHHYLHTRMSLEAGKAVLCEKAFTIDAAELEELIDLAGRKKLFLMEALWTRFLPHINKAMSLIAEGAIGTLNMVQADFGFKADFIPEKRLFNRDLGGGALLDIGIYPVFLAYLLLGFPEQVEAIAAIGTTGVDEQIAISMRHRNNTISSLNSTLVSSTRIEATLYGSQGSIRMSKIWFGPTKIQLFRDGSPEELFDFSYDDNGFEYEAAEVMKCLDQGKTMSSIWSLHQSLELMRLLDEIRFKCGIFYPNRIR